MVDDSPCNGICKIVDDNDGTPKCIRCKRTYEDIDDWFKLSREARLYRMDWDSVSKTEYHLCKACEALNLPVGDVPKLVRDMELLIVAARKGAVAGNVKTQGCSVPLPGV